MMAVQYIHADKEMVSAITAESPYDTIVGTYTSSQYKTLKNFELAISYDDTRQPAGQGDGTEFGLESYVSRHDVRMTLTQNMATAEDVGWMSAFALGITDETANTSDYLHDHTLTTVSQLPSFTVHASEAGEENEYSGCVIDSLVISTDNAGYIQAVATIIGSGRRTTNTETFVAISTEPPLISNMTSIFMETGAAIDIQALAVDGTTSLTATTASIDLTARVLGGWTVTINNNHRADQGYLQPNSDDNLARGELLRGAKREMTVELSGVTFESDEFEDFFLGATATAIQPHMAVEIHNFNDDYGVIVTSWFYTMAIIFPRMTLDPLGAASEDDGIITRDLKLTALTPVSGDDGTSDPIQFYTRDSIAAYAG